MDNTREYTVLGILLLWQQCLGSVGLRSTGAEGLCLLWCDGSHLASAQVHSCRSQYPGRGLTHCLVSLRRKFKHSSPSCETLPLPGQGLNSSFA